MITEQGCKTSLRSLIEQEAMSPEYKFDEGKQKIYGRGTYFDGSQEEVDRLNKHHAICMFLCAISNEYDKYPLTPLVYIAIGGSAHKQSEFQKGYTSYDAKKTRKILQWLTRLSKRCKDIKYMSNDRVVHAVVKFYDKVSKDDNIFYDLLKQFDPKGKKASHWKTMESFYSEFVKPMYDNVQII